MIQDFNKVPGYVRKEIDFPGKTVMKGNRSSSTKQIQEWLNYHGFRTGIDQDYGPATEECVRDFQRAKGLSISGKVTQQTWEALVEPMKYALQAPEGIETMNDSLAVRAAAEQHLSRRPVEIGGENCGPWVRLYCKGNDGKHWAWCAGFVSMIMHQAFFYRGLETPFEGSVSCDLLATQAKQANRFVSGKDVAKNDFNWENFNGCCVFLRRRTSGDWTHTGFGLDLKSSAFSTIEGNTNDEGVREGFEACSRKRSITGDYDFIMF